MFNIFCIIIFFILIFIIKKYIIVSKMFMNFINLTVFYTLKLRFFFYKYLFNHNLQLKFKDLVKKLNFKKLFIFFQFGSKKHVYFKSWFNNLKKKKNWIWKWRN